MPFMTPAVSQKQFQTGLIVPEHLSRAHHTLMFYLRISSILLSCLLAGAVNAFTTFPNCSQSPLSSIGICDTSQDPVSRAQALAEVLTVAEIVENSGNAALGVPRLGLPAYEWWSEALVNKFAWLYLSA